MAEETVNNKTFKALVEEQKKTTTAIRQQMMSAEERSAEETLEREKSEEKYLKNQERGFKADATRLANLAKSTPTAAEAEETATENNSYLKNTFSKFLGKGSFLAGTLGGIGKSLKQKVTGGIEGIFKALKAGAFVAFLLGMAKFLESETFQDMKDKYLPAITKGLEKLGKALKNIADGFFTVETDELGNEIYKFDFLAGVKNIFSMIGDAFIAFGAKLKAGFFDEEGNFQLLAGLKNVADNVLLTAAALAAFALLMSPGRFFGKAFVLGIRGGGKLFGGTMRLIASGFGLLFPHLTGFSKSLTKTGGQMSLDLKQSKTMGGVFGKGVKGIMGSFGRLFFFLGKGIVGKKGLVGLLLGAGLLMANKLKDTKVFTKITSAFGKMFTVLSDLGAKIANTAVKAGSKLAKPLGRGAATVFEQAGERAKYLASIAKATGRGAAIIFEKAGERAKFLASIAKTQVGRGAATIFERAGDRAKYLKGLVKGSTVAKTQVGRGAAAFVEKAGDRAKYLKGLGIVSRTASKAVFKSIMKKIPFI